MAGYQILAIPETTSRRGMGPRFTPGSPLADDALQVGGPVAIARARVTIGEVMVAFVHRRHISQRVRRAAYCALGAVCASSPAWRATAEPYRVVDLQTLGWASGLSGGTQAPGAA